MEVVDEGKPWGYDVLRPMMASDREHIMWALECGNEHVPRASIHPVPRSRVLSAFSHHYTDRGETSSTSGVHQRIWIVQKDILGMSDAFPPSEKFEP